MSMAPLVSLVLCPSTPMEKPKRLLLDRTEELSEGQMWNKAVVRSTCTGASLLQFPVCFGAREEASSDLSCHGVFSTCCIGIWEGKLGNLPIS